MKKKLLSMFAIATMLFATSCSQEDDFAPVADGTEVAVSFTAQLPQELATRAYSNGLTAQTLMVAFYDAADESDVKTPLLQDTLSFNGGLTTTVNVNLATGKTYNVIFWAQSPENETYSINWKAQTMTVDYEAMKANDENNDAFYAFETFYVTGALNEEVELYRPFAQVNLGTSDYMAAYKAGLEVSKTSLATTVANTLYFADGTVGGEDELEVIYQANTIPVTVVEGTIDYTNEANEKFPVAGYDYLEMNYLLVGVNQTTADMTFYVTEKEGAELTPSIFVSNVPVRRNYRTNIYGALLTDPAQFNVTIEPAYKEPDYEVAMPWDGKTVEEPTEVDGVWVIKSPAQWVGLKAKGTQGKNIKLGADLDFGGYEIKGLALDGEFDGQGYTMSNMTLLCGGSYYSNGLFQGDASGNATVKNVTIKNVVAECNNPDQGYVGVIFGDVQKSTDLENVHVVNADLCGVQSVGGLVGFVAEPATLNVNKCSVDGSYIHNYAVANESGYTAGLVGRPRGTVNVTNSTVSNTTIEAYYAPRRGEGSIQPVVGDNTTLTADNTVVVNKISLENAVFVATAEELCKVNVTDGLVILTADIDFDGAQMTNNIQMWGNSTFDGQGHKISNVVAFEQGQYAKSLFRGDSCPGNKVVKNLIVDGITATGASFAAAAIWSDLQSANIVIDNVHIYDADIQSDNSTGGFVGFVSGGTTEVVIKNSSINASSINGGNRTGALVGRAYGCPAQLDKVVVKDVTVNGAAATLSTIVRGENTWEGNVTVE